MIRWVDILKAYKDGKFDRYYYGLTPKLLVGACQEPMESNFENEHVACEVTKRLFDEMQSYEDDGLIVTSNHCGIHNGPVMKLAEGKLTRNSIGTNFDEIWKSYGEEIIEGNFGINSYDRKILKSISY